MEITKSLKQFAKMKNLNDNNNRFCEADVWYHLPVKLSFNRVEGEVVWKARLI